MFGLMRTLSVGVACSLITAGRSTATWIPVLHVQSGFCEFELLIGQPTFCTCIGLTSSLSIGETLCWTAANWSAAKCTQRLVISSPLWPSLCYQLEAYSHSDSKVLSESPAPA